MKAKLIYNINDSDESKSFLRAVKADDMAAFIWELLHNGWRDFKHTEYDYQPAWDKIISLLNDYNINIDELYE